MNVHFKLQELNDYLLFLGSYLKNENLYFKVKNIVLIKVETIQKVSFNSELIFAANNKKQVN